jgi:hypothetical protein
MAGVCHAIGNELTLFILFEWCVQRIMMVDHSLPRHFLIASTSSFLCNIVYVTMAEGWLGSDEFFFFFFSFYSPYQSIKVSCHLFVMSV